MIRDHRLAAIVRAARGLRDMTRNALTGDVFDDGEALKMWNKFDRALNDHDDAALADAEAHNGTGS